METQPEASVATSSEPVAALESTGPPTLQDVSTPATPSQPVLQAPVPGIFYKPRVLAPTPVVVSPASPTPADPDNDLVPEDEEEIVILDPPIQYRPLSKALKAYQKKSQNNSTICDIIAVYLKGQKILYTEAKTVCEQRLNYLMLPAIFITAICTILSLVLKDFSHGPTIVSSLTGFNTFILALINYLKLDAKAEAHRTSAYKFDKIQSEMEFSSGKMLFDAKASEKFGEILERTENNVKEIKETNQFILPESVRFAFPVLYNMNLFANVKKILNLETIYVNRLKDIMNEQYELNQKPQRTKSDNDKLKELKESQKRTIEHILSLQDQYVEIDAKFEKEMKSYREHITRRFAICGWLKT